MIPQTTHNQVQYEFFVAKFKLLKQMRNDYDCHHTNPNWTATERNTNNVTLHPK
jgi:hypothetical protein